MPIINDFRGEYSFLSNFAPARVVLDDEVYWTVEHAFQAAKTLDPLERVEIRITDNPSRAKRLGRRVTLRPDWEEVKIEIMEGLLRQKFSIGVIRRKLLLTRPAILVEGNTWHDTFWGVCQGVGRNELGKLLMKIRDQERN